MEKSFDDFISHDKKKFKWKIGKALASAFSGFIAGIIVTVIFIVAIFNLTLK